MRFESIEAFLVEFPALDPFPNLAANTRPQTRHRGVMYWSENEDRRILITAGMYLYALNADNGDIIASFGKGGKVDPM